MARLGQPRESERFVIAASASSAVEGSVTPCLRKPSIGPRAAIAASVSGSVPRLVGADRDQVGLLACRSAISLRTSLPAARTSGVTISPTRRETEASTSIAG